MRAFILTVGLLATPAVAEDLKPFDFMGYTAGEPIPARELRKCRGKGGNVTCYAGLTKLSTVHVRGYSVTIHDYKLSTVYVEAHPDSYAALLEAFTAKYGQPCEMSDQVWRNAVGLELDNPTLYWCFTSGRLMFAKYGATLDSMAILYEDENRAPKAEPVINF